MWAECEKCNRFSHCNNNELVCKSKYNEIYRQADTYKSKLEQIVEKCKKEIRVYRNTLLPNDGTNTLHFGRQLFAYDILQMLDIEEINPKIKRSECPYGGIDCAWCGEECE